MISQELYIEPLVSAQKLSLGKVTGILSSLRNWTAAVPSHLSRSAHIAPSQRRAVAMLHVRYFSVVILTTRPFLLCSVLCQERLQHPAKRKCYDELGQMCIDAAQNSLSILHTISHLKLLSSLTPSDFNYLLELVQIFLIASAKFRDAQYLEKARKCLNVLLSMDDLGWCQKGLPETVAQLRNCGILPDTIQQDAVSDDNVGALFANIEPNVDMYDNPIVDEGLLVYAVIVEPR